MPNWVLRPIREADYPAVVQFIHRNLREINSKDYSPEIIDFMVQYYSPTAMPGLVRSFQQLLVVDHQLQPVAVGGWKWAEPNGEAQKVGYISTMFVEPKFHKRGLGKLVLTALEKSAIQANVKSLILNASLGAVGFYEKLGYQRVIQKDQGKFGHVWAMEKRLV